MVCCTFFGHRKAEDIKERLNNAIEKMITENHVTCFYVGCNGGFDKTVTKVLPAFEKRYGIKYFIVLPSLKEAEKVDPAVLDKTILPDGFEKFLPRFAVDKRNRWMISGSDFAITYVKNEIASGAAKYKKIAEKKGLTIVELSGS